MGISTRAPIPATAFQDLTGQMELLERFVRERAQPARSLLLELPPDRRQSAENLFHYLALRSEDIRPLQDRLARLGLSSLGRSESHVLATIKAVLNHLYMLSGQQPQEPVTRPHDIPVQYSPPRYWICPLRR